MSAGDRYFFWHTVLLRIGALRIPFNGAGRTALCDAGGAGWASTEPRRGREGRRI